MTENNDSCEKYADIVDYEWNEDSLKNRMPLSQRAKIFLPFAALSGYDEALQETLRKEIAQMNERHGEVIQEI